MLRSSVRARLTRAARLLHETALPIMEIALECGYAGRQSFTDAFTRAYGSSPAAFRRRGLFWPLRTAADHEALLSEEVSRMEPKTSLTALLSAYARAYHTLHAPQPVFEDPIARRLFTDEEWGRVTALLENGKAFFPDADTLDDIVETHLAPTPVCRAAFCEDALRTAVQLGTASYVLLGAGLDTFARREPALCDRLRVYELDLPATQRDKAERLRRAGLSDPAGLTRIPIDLSSESLADALRSAGFDPARRAFFSWLGVSYYLDRDAIDRMLASISSVCAEGSTLVFDCADEGLFTASEPRVQRMVAMALAAGEPMKSCFSVPELTRLLARHGFLIYELLEPEDISERIIRGRGGIRAFEHIRYVLAVKKDR